MVQLVYETIQEKQVTTIDKTLPSGIYFNKAIANDKMIFVKHIVK